MKKILIFLIVCLHSLSSDSNISGTTSGSVITGNCIRDIDCGNGCCSVYKFCKCYLGTISGGQTLPCIGSYDDFPSCTTNADCSNQVCFSGQSYIGCVNNKCYSTNGNTVAYQCVAKALGGVSSCSVTTGTTIPAIATSTSKTAVTMTISLNARQSVIASVAAALTNMNSGTNSVETAKAISNLLKTDKDILACLTNCSNNGLCTLDSNQNFVCSCFEFYSGKSCETDLRPCSSCPCLKEGICTNILNTTVYDFECKCKYPYYSRYCELKINLCKNITCSKQGWCYVNETIPFCKCFTGYSGKNCDIQSQELKRIKMVNDISGYLAITVIVLFFSMFICMDISKFFMQDKNKIKQTPTKKRIVTEPAIKKTVTYKDYIEAPDSPVPPLKPNPINIKPIRRDSRIPRVNSNEMKRSKSISKVINKKKIAKAPKTDYTVP